MIRLALFCTLSALPAAAQDACASRDAVLRTLTEKYGEEQVGAGLAGNYIFEIWASEETGTWSVLRTGTNGVSCILASGKYWRDGIKEAPGIDG